MGSHIIRIRTEPGHAKVTSEEPNHDTCKFFFFFLVKLGLSLVRSLKRLLRLRGDPRQMPPLATLPVDQGRVLRHPVVPDDYGVLFPFDPGVEVGS